ncbi:hypothetical protein AB6H27_13765 [Providencia huaxiensis]|uniref:hypothetical protein n=1 Tax=Providencia huaxiensis TaxID=2027290 RepID=UPI0018A788ED
MWLNITSGDFNVNTAGDNNIIGGDTLLNLNDIYFQKLFILRGESHEIVKPMLNCRKTQEDL